VGGPHCIRGALESFLRRTLRRMDASACLCEYSEGLLGHCSDASACQASILLTSNIAFLTVPNVTSETAVVHGTLVQIPSYVSTIATIGSIVLGLALNRQHKNRKRSNKLEKSTAVEVVRSVALLLWCKCLLYPQHEWLTKRWHTRGGLEPLAVMYSLPFALLMWA
jgi:hypothetical protein